MKKILIFTRDALFRAGISHQILGKGAGVICLSNPELVKDCLDSGEVNFLVADLPADSGDVVRWIKKWMNRPAVRYIVTGCLVPPSVKDIMKNSGVQYRIVGKAHCKVLIVDIIDDLMPGFFQGSGEKKDSSAAERRRVTRFDKTLRVFLDCRERALPGEIKSRTVNISSSGARIVTRVPLKTYSMVDTKILLPSFSEILPLRGRVMWSRPDSARSGFVSGIFFDWFCDTDRFDLTNYLARETV